MLEVVNTVGVAVGTVGLSVVVGALVVESEVGLAAENMVVVMADVEVVGAGLVGENIAGAAVNMIVDGASVEVPVAARDNAEAFVEV
jgi:hypothetical protein